MINRVELDQISQIVRRVGRSWLGDAHTTGFPRGEASKEDGSVVTQTDIGIQTAMAAELRRIRPEIAFLGEEMTHAEQTQILDRSDGRVWVLDPLDGTTNFVAGFPFYGVSLALLEDSEAILGVVYDPVRDELFCAYAGGGAYLNGVALKGNANQIALGQCVANVDYKRLTHSLSKRLVRFPPYRSQRNLGSCVLEWCWLAAGRFQLYLHGGEKLWDYAAGVLILQETGGVAKTFEGQAVSCRGLNKKSVIAASTPTLFNAWQEWFFREGGCGRSPQGFGSGI